ncbi:MAG: thioredoxin domain-containing protein [Gammaproteobacteria bacterium]|nr:thioredoxin domain-containing protein [Gammaproteobacteria bacterium]
MKTPRPLRVRLVLLCALLMVAPRGFADEGNDAFVLRQLIEMQNDIKRLTVQIVEMRKSIDSLKTAGPVAAAAGAANGVPRQAAAPVQAPAQPQAGVPETVRIDAADAVAGDAQATLAIVEFSDYQCPFCARFHEQTYPQLKQQYIDTGKIKYVMKDFPLGFHPQARAAAIAADCAARQVGLDPVMQSLFADQATLGEPVFSALVEKLSLSEDQYERCRVDAATASGVDADMAYGQSIGVRGTPTFFIGKLDGDTLVQVQKIVGAQPLAAFARAIEMLQ